jgi:hypothetical protein
MSDAELTVNDRPLSPIQIFCMKVVVVTLAVLVFFYFAGWVVESAIRRQADALILRHTDSLTGGRAFWVNAEKTLLELADEPDVSPEKKKKILDALRKLSSKYKPYFEALNGDVPPDETTPH